MRCWCGCGWETWCHLMGVDIHGWIEVNEYLDEWTGVVKIDPILPRSYDIRSYAVCQEYGQTSRTTWARTTALLRSS